MPNVAGVILIAAILLMMGCTTRTGPVVFGAGAVESRLAIDDARAERVLAIYYDTTEERHGLRGSARVALSGPDFKLNRPQNIAVKRPANLRFEIVGLFDQLAAVLATDGDEYGFYEAGESKIERGILTPGLFWNLAKIDLDPEELVGILLGTPLPSPGIARAAVWLEAAVADERASRIAIAFAWPESEAGATDATDALGAGGAMGVDCAADSALLGADPACFLSPEAMATGAEIFVFDEGARLVEMRAVDASGRLRYRAEYEEYEPLAASAAAAEAAMTLFPNCVTIESSEAESVARFEWKRVMLADDLSDQHFRIPERGGRPSGG